MANKKWPTGIRPHGNGIQIRLSRGGKYIYSETIPGDPYKTGDLTAAINRRNELKSRLRLGLPLFDGDEKKVELFANVAQDYLSGLDVEYSTSLGYENILNRYWLPAFGNWLLTDIKPKHIKERLAKLSVSQKTKKNLLNPLSGVFAYGADNDLCDSNPVGAVKLKKHQKPKIERFYPEERDRILQQLSGQALAYFSLFFATGMRPGELLGLKWSDWNGEKLHVHRQIVRRKIKTSTKTHEARYVFVPTWARTAFLALDTRGTHEWVFVNTAKRPWLDTDCFNAAWKEALTSASVEYRIPYVCRHTRAAELLSMGNEPGRAATELGHSVEMFFRTYSEWIDEYSRGEDKSKLEGTGPKMGRVKKLRVKNA